MIIAKLIGGLGNQMFQYAAARAVAHRTKLPLKIDISSFESYQLHSYLLRAYNIEENLAAKDDLQQFLKPGVFPWQKKKIYKERWFHFDPDLLKLKGSAFLDGYWQSEKYFADISDIIRREFTIKNEPAGLNKQILAKIDSVNSVSLHIRRGDYVTNPEAFNILGVLSRDYYFRAIDSIISQVQNPHFFVFSDDIIWAKNNLKIQPPIDFIEHNGKKDAFEDMRLMSNCKYQIIANSTFSWWGAWLNKNPNKIVIAPQNWFKEYKVNTRDLLPAGWLRT